ncbi:MAG: 16S rRNA (cytosine(1402)-N(4))-methyltransferase RsmH, partial [Candidatus Aminicenantales bacterium]
MMAHGHIPVLLEAALEYLDVQREGTYIDGTFGLGGHSIEILRRNPRASVIGFDRDELTLREAQDKLDAYKDRLRLYHADFRDLPEEEIDFASVRGLLLDLGMSSFQLDSPERGFSFNADGPLDMRMDTRQKTTAARILEKYPEARLDTIFREYGELPHSRRLAREIVTRRKLRPFETTAQLRRLIEEIYRWRPMKGKIHPAAKAFQALRIEVNPELEGLGSFLERTAAASRPGTRFVVISFHSLEDRIIKRTFAPAADGAGPRLFEALTRKPVVASAEEIAGNSRSRSAKLRAAERV